MENTANLNHPSPRTTGIIAIVAAISMFIGAACWGASGVDLWAAISSDKVAAYLQDIQPIRHLLIANTTFWILGVTLLGIAGSLMSGLPTQRPTAAWIAQTCIRAAVPIAIVAFLGMVAIPIQLAGDTSPEAIAVATYAGWLFAFADNLATVLIVGAGPFFLVMAGHKGWAPNWLRIWGILAGIVAVLFLAHSTIQLNTPLTPVMVLCGLGWMIAAGVVLLKRPAI